MLCPSGFFREHDSLEVCLQERLSWSLVWEMLHPSFPFFGSYNTCRGVKSTEKSCKKDTFYFFPQDDFISGHSPPNKKASLSPHLPLFFVLFWFFGGVPINSNGAVVSRTFVKRCARPVVCRKSTDWFPWLAFCSSDQSLQTYLWAALACHSQPSATWLWLTFLRWFLAAPHHTAYVQLSESPIVLAP